MANVLLLRAPTPGSDDRYEATFNSAGYLAVSVPVLETVLTNLSSLKDIIKDGPISDNYEGVVMTSGRACEAWDSAVRDLVKYPVVGQPLQSGWDSVPFYAVGPGTASALKDIRDAYGHTVYAPEDLRGGSSGTGERLAHFILEDSHERARKLLYLTGDKNRDTLPKILNEGGIELRPLKVYETQGSSNFERDLTEAVKSASGVFDRWWIIHFAPSAAGFVTPIIRDHFNLLPAKSPSVGRDSTPRIAAIGPVTSSFLRDELNIHVDVTSPNPKPEDLLAAIAAFDRDRCS